MGIKLVFVPEATVVTIPSGTINHIRMQYRVNNIAAIFRSKIPNKLSVSINGNFEFY